ncbi:MAG: CoB--CoM heterodisulfide reductase iron-sulfur subunit A family protein [Dethiobacter sp.]|nr:MAG: CoB--CoM heterodisulfide reductase iron-sulfur subunit A family protein [Dethiobacter sp.]
MRRIGVFVCWCGTNIAGTVDIEAVVEAAKKMPGVVYTGEYKYMCSEIGQSMIRDTIKKEQLDRLVIASCSPRMHEATFRRTAAAAGLNPYLVEIANIREHCSWVHKEKEKATTKAIALIRAAVAKAAYNRELVAGEIPVEQRALVIGAGIAGIQAALDIADAGFEVDLVERTPSIGGRMAQLDKTFPTLDCSACILTPKMVDVASHPHINLYTYSEVEKVEGYVGNFDVTIRKKARSIDMSRCTGCGVCLEKCPIKVDSEFNEGLIKRKAIYIPFPQAVPNVPVIDRTSCRWFKKGKCAVCKKVCPADAVDYEQADELLEKKYGGIVLTTGFDTLKLDEFGEFGYGKHPDIITSLEFERLINASGPTGGKLVRLSNQEIPQNIVFIHCVGSRDKARGKPYCSKICCMYTAKHAILLKEKYPHSQTYIFYIDVRTGGKEFEEFHRRAVEEYGAVYFRGIVGKVFPEGDKLLVQGVDSLSSRTIEIEADMVVLAAAMQARDDAAEVARMLGIGVDTHHFFVEAHPKLRPVETHSAGIYLAGACQGPKDIPETVAQAGAAAAKAIVLLSKKTLIADPCVSEVNEEICTGCLACIQVCPYKAITEKTLDQKVHGRVVQRLLAQVNEALCQGCGSCTAACRPGAINLKSFSNDQILAEVDAVCL